MNPLDHVLRHNTWATATLLQFCRGLDPARLDDRADGTYGTLYGTLQHLVGAEQWYVRVLTGELVGTRIQRDQRHTLDELASIAAQTGARALAIAASDDPDRPIEMSDGHHTTAGTVLAQLVHPWQRASHARHDDPGDEQHRAARGERLGLRPRGRYL